MRSSSDQPNILFIQADQLSPRFLGCYGNDIAQSPHIDAIGNSGTVFENAYSNFPLCAPSRFSMLAGQLASRIGAYDNGAEFPSAVPTFIHYLRNAGYQTCLSGKMHFVGADQLHGFEQRLTTDIYPGDFNWTGDWTEKTPEFANDSRSFTGAGVCSRNPQIDYDDEVCHRAVRHLFDMARSDDNRPFMFLVSFTHPHDPYQCPQEYWDRYRHADIDMPVTPNIAPQDDDPYCRRLRALSGLDSFQPDAAQTRIARHAYYGSISYLDDLVGRLLDTLNETGQADNTVIVFTSDHGDSMGERGLWYKKHFFDHAALVPLLIKAPGIGPSTIRSSVSLVDLLPTLCELAGDDAAPVEPVDGRSLIDQMKGGSHDSFPVRVENLAEGAGAPAVMVRHGNIKYIHCEIDPPQLFDLAIDPHELTNCASDPAYADVLIQMQEMVHAGWDLKSLDGDIKLSQKRRLFLRKVLATGRRAPWDYAAPDQLEAQVLRSTSVYNNWAYDNVLGLKPDPESSD